MTLLGRNYLKFEKDQHVFVGRSMYSTYPKSYSVDPFQKIMDISEKKKKKKLQLISMLRNKSLNLNEDSCVGAVISVFCIYLKTLIDAFSYHCVCQ